MKRSYQALIVVVIVGISEMRSTGNDSPTKAKVATLSATDVVEKLDGKDAKATTVEVTLEPGQSSPPHRHPGPVFGYVLEGEYEWAINDQPSKKLKVGETF